MTQMTAMTSTRLIRPRTAVPQPAGLLARLLAAWLKRRRMRRDEIWLKRQPDYLLRDIGISRGEIDAIIHNERYR